MSRVEAVISSAVMEPGKAEFTPQPRYEVRPYRPEEAELIYKELEEPNWAPWLRASVDTLRARAEVFPQGQIALWDTDTRSGREGRKRPVAVINLQRFNYDDPEHLLTWDELCGDPPDFRDRFDPQGNAVSMMSINVHKDYQGGNLTTQIVYAVRNMAKANGVAHIMGSFRPSQYGDFAYQNPEVTLEEYAHDRVPWKNGGTTRRDQWIGILENKFGMQELRWDEAAMTVTLPREEFEQYKATYKPDKWVQRAPGIWLCGETGFWVDRGDQATYIEGNIWGILRQAS